VQDGAAWIETLDAFSKHVDAQRRERSHSTGSMSSLGSMSPVPETGGASGGDTAAAGGGMGAGGSGSPSAEGLGQRTASGRVRSETIA
jgi:hypothetical protein